MATSTNYNEYLKSEFNSSLDVLTRINVLFQQANLMAYNEDYKGWSRILNIIHRELYKFIPEKEKDGMLKTIMWIHEQTLFLNSENISKELYWKMHNTDTFLRNVFHSSGLGLKTKEEDDDWAWD